MKNITIQTRQSKPSPVLKRLVAAAGVALTLSLTPSLMADEYSASKHSTAVSPSADKDIVAIAAGAENLKTLVAAVKAAGLVDLLQSDGPFTVFAPTDEAFAKLPAGTLESLLKPENREKLVAILKYHVVPGKVTAAQVKTMKAKTALGQPLDIQVSDAGVKVDNAKVIKTDIIAKNGVIHVIDTVLLPKS